MPVSHFSERHSRWIDATPQRVWDALQTLTLDHLWITRPLVVIRHLGADDGQSSGRSLFTDGPVSMVEVDPPRYAVGGAIARPWQYRPQRHPVESLAQFAAFAEPGWVKYLTDFHLKPDRGGVQLISVTRGYGTNWAARARFAPYWMLIRLPSGLIRRDILAAVARAATTRADFRPPL